MTTLQIVNQLSHVAYRLSQMANKHLEQLSGKCKAAEETQDYYLGMLRRQAMITHDLHLILVDRPQENLTTPYILLRALMDDFIHLLYLDLSETFEEDIVRINATGHKDNFNSLKNLTNSENQEYHGESFGYLSPEDFENLKEEFKQKEKNQKYFQNIETFRFKEFRSLTDMALSINSTNKDNVARDRAFFMWKAFPSFVHYSNWCYDYEMTADILKIRQIEESLQYVFNTIHIIANYFKKTKGIDVMVDTYILKEMKFGLLRVPTR